MIGGRGNTHPDLTFEHVVEALTKTRGFILGAKKYLKKTYGYDVSFHTIKSRIQDWGMEEWLQEIRTSLVEDCMQKAFHKGIENGDNQCLFWAINKYGHHVDFIDGNEDETESKKAWRVILDHVKNNIESQADIQPKE